MRFLIRSFFKLLKIDIGCTYGTELRGHVDYFHVPDVDLHSTRIRYRS